MKTLYLNTYPLGIHYSMLCSCQLLTNVTINYMSSAQLLVVKYCAVANWRYVQCLSSSSCEM